ncbi:MAG: type 2 isopentenyl-diphosphate Delta-isomerase [Actinomycetota bacterium]
MASNSLRKVQHLNISLTKNLNPPGASNGFSAYRFVHQALPELDLAKIELSTAFMGRELKLPLMISPLVGGIRQSTEINRKLAAAAQKKGIAMGVGSQRAAIEDVRLADTYRVRDVAPDILLFANLGAVQLNYGYGVKHCRAAVDMIGADALMLHLNCMQEAFQPEGNHDFSGLAERIAGVCSKLGVPVFAREVGCGISAEAAGMLMDCGVAGIDAAGSGGTSWVAVERHRSASPVLKKVASGFGQWGISTAESIAMVRSKSSDIPLIASGGIRDGLEVAKCIALGADIAGIALPMLKKASISVKALEDYIDELESGLRIAMFGIGAADISQLKNTKHMAKVN